MNKWWSVVTPKRVMVVGTLLFVVGVGLLLSIVLREPSKEAISNLGSLLALLGVVSVTYALSIARGRSILQNELSRVQEGLVRVGERNALGLIEVHPDASVYDYTDILTSPRTLFILLNDGRTWTSVHRDRLRKRFANPTKETTIFLIHPMSSLLPILARKGNTDTESIVSKIKETRTILREIGQPNTRLEVLGHHLYNTYSACVGNREAIVTPYFVSRGGRTVPVFRYEDTGTACFFRDLIEDLERLKLDSEDISEFFEEKREQQADIVPLKQKG